MPLSKYNIDSAKPRDKRYKLSDSDGLYLEVMTSGKKYWRLRYFKDGKRSWHTIGEYPATGIQEARERRNDLRKRIREKKSIVQTSQSFVAIAEEWRQANARKLSSEKYKTALRARLNTHIIPFIGERDINDIKTLYWR